MSEFSYEPLRSSRSIRLIRFLPGPTPKCQMIAVEVERAPPYVALSYTWGSKELVRSIMVNECEMSITVNLAEAIEAIYSFARERRMMFWADSICINQNDIHERGKQVQIMNTIYRSAEIVTIWLGPAADDSSLALDQIEEWKVKIDEVKAECGDRESVAMRTFLTQHTSHFGPNGSQLRGLEALRMICRRRWWKRAWIVQEVTIVNSSRLFLFCGARQIGWASLREALAINHYVTQFWNSGTQVGLDHEMASILNHFRNKRQSGTHIRLLEVLRYLRAYECDDPRDKVFAALGMAMDVTENDIIPDYTKPVAAVYRDVVEFYLSKSDNHSLDFLGTVVSRSPGTVFKNDHSATLPSWVPDWMFRINMFPFEKRVEFDGYEESSCLYKACGSLTGNYSVNGDYLHLQGSVVDKITRLWITCDRVLAEGGLEIEQSWTPENPTQQYFTGETVMAAFNHTIVADTSLRGSSAGDRYFRGFVVKWDLLGKDKNTMTARESTMQDWMLNSIKRTTYQRRLFETSRGFIGIGPDAAEIGDQVCVLLGGQVLYVLRPQNGRPNHHRFIGECYVHGMMDGQAIQDNVYSCRDFILE